MIRKNDIVICSVNYAAEELLNLNYELTFDVSEFDRWLVYNNTHETSNLLHTNFNIQFSLKQTEKVNQF